MMRKRNLIRYLLILCVALAPVVGAGELALEHHASMGCTDCGGAETTVEHACDNESCLVLNHACSAGFCTGFIPEKAVGIGAPAVRSTLKPAAGSAFESNPVDSIFRPPIA